MLVYQRVVTIKRVEVAWSRCRSLFQDGITWQQVSDHASWTARSGHAVVAFNEQIWVLAGENSPIGDLAAAVVSCVSLPKKPPAMTTGRAATLQALHLFVATSKAL